MPVARKVLINASNLHAGGGVQVAVSIIFEISSMRSVASDINLLISSEVYENLLSLNVDFANFKSCKVFNIYGFQVFPKDIRKIIFSVDVVLTVFGPLYCLYLKPVSIVGFAQPWIIFPNNEVYKLLKFKNYCLNKIKFFIQSIYFRRANYIIVELGFVAAKFAKILNYNPDNISVIHNTIQSLYFNRKVWQSVVIPPCEDIFSIGFISRDYPHKNVDILPLVKLELLNTHGVNVNFFTTLSDEELCGKDDFFRESIINVGVLNVAQCPSFYQQMDAVIFPSLLECFSATPLEAMFMKKPLFASDRDFIRDVCMDYAYYFDPFSVSSIAKVIADYIQKYNEDPNGCQALLAEAHDYVANFSNARNRALSYLNVIEKV